MNLLAFRITVSWQDSSCLKALIIILLQAYIFEMAIRCRILIDLTGEVPIEVTVVVITNDNHQVIISVEEFINESLPLIAAIVNNGIVEDVTVVSQ